MFVARLKSHWRSLKRRRAVEQTLDEELRFHLDSTTTDLVNQGHSQQEARRLAHLALGTSTTTQKEECRASLGLRLYDELRADTRYALRMLRKDPLLTTVAIASMALAIGANTALFSVAKTVLFNTFGVSHPEQLRLLRWQFAGPHQPIESIYGQFSETPGGAFTSTSFSYPVYQRLNAQTDCLGGIAALEQSGLRPTVIIHHDAETLGAQLVSGNFFHVLGAATLIGRPITPADEIGNPNVAVLSYDLWTRRFAQSRDVLGQTITLNAVPVTIIGVTAPQFHGPGAPELFLPVTLKSQINPAPNHEGDQIHNGRSWWLLLLARLKPGVSEARAKAELDAALQQAAKATIKNRSHADLSKLTLTIEDAGRGQELLRSRLAQPVAILFALVALLLLLACTNVANLLVARSTARSREMAVRKALGAGRARIVRQMLTESLLLAFLAGIAGLFLAFALRRAIPYFLDLAQPPPFDWPVLAFTLSLTLLTGVLFGLAPALQAFREHRGLAVNESSRLTADRPKAGLRKLLVVFEVALSTMLLLGALLFLRTLTNLLNAPLGFEPAKLLLFEVRPSPLRYTVPERIALLASLEQRLAALPGVHSVALVNDVLISGSLDGSNFDRNDQPYRDGREALKNTVSTAFFQTVGMPILRGRSFDARDTASSPKVAIVNEQLAHVYFPKEDPIGKTFNGDRIRIVGVAANARYSDLRTPPAPTYFQPYTQLSDRKDLSFYVKSNADPKPLTSAIRKTIAAVDPELPVLNVRTQEAEISSSVAHERLFATLTSAFGALALFLAAIGIYGVMSYTVARRTNEVGIRLALGAQTRQILQMMMTEGLLLAFAGCTAGIAAALYLTRYVRSWFYAVTSHDPVILLAAIAILLSSAALAVWLPARRAARISPVEALRQQ